MLSGRLSRGAYARAVAIRIGLFVAATLAFPFLLYGLAKITNCSSIGGACGALAFVVALYVKPTLYLLLVLSFIGITIRRVRDVGLPVWLAAAVPVLMLGDLKNGMLFDTKIINAFKHPDPFTYASVPRLLIMAGICVGFLCVARSKDAVDAERWGLPGAFAFGIVVLSSIGALFSFGQYLTSLLGGLDAMQKFRNVELYEAIFGSPILLIAMFVVIARRQRRLVVSPAT
jgi:uncharacterized membrane protein YhaH (DUF805 family)